MKSLFIFFLLLCVSIIKIKAQIANQFDGYPSVKSVLNKKIWTTNETYYQLTKATDSTVSLYWGNHSLKRRYNIDFNLWSAERLQIKWTNKNYLILQYGTGSGTWIDIFLPINKKEKTEEVFNGVYLDKVDNLFASQGYDDTILIVQNLKTKQHQFIIEKEHRCNYPNNDCINTVNIKDKMLYLKWTLPNNFTNEKEKIFERKIKLHI